ncbi:WbqC family protein [Kitasatospora sp. NPDC057940]|uniref:WbqC family protein n=1 Tax=Kitasatospora sp. NPDC057940 TaxID=3346285 RepID=UPI0036D8BD2B
MRTSGSWPTDSTASCSTDTAPPAGLVCAIHQPNLFPRLSTVAKLFAADVWIVLDDVQFARRDYQHRARLAPAAGAPGPIRWLSVPTHLPAGRATLIRDARMVDPARGRRRSADLLREHYRGAPHWAAFRNQLDAFLDVFERTDRTGAVAQESTLLLLSMVGWSGQVPASTDLHSSSDRSQRLADLGQLEQAGEEVAARDAGLAHSCGPGAAPHRESSTMTDRRSATAARPGGLRGGVRGRGRLAPRRRGDRPRPGITSGGAWCSVAPRPPTG